MLFQNGIFFQYFIKLFSTPFLLEESSFCHILQLARGRRSLFHLPVEEEFEKQYILYFTPSNWPVAQIS